MNKKWNLPQCVVYMKMVCIGNIGFQLLIECLLLINMSFSKWNFRSNEPLLMMVIRLRGSPTIFELGSFIIDISCQFWLPNLLTWSSWFHPETLVCIIRVKIQWTLPSSNLSQVLGDLFMQWSWLQCHVLRNWYRPYFLLRHILETLVTIVPRYGD